VSKRCSFRKELADEAVEILIGATLFGTVSISEIHVTLEKSLDEFVVPELEPVIKRNRADGKTAERKLHDAGDGVRVERLYFPNDPEA
jgi:hypothetical protein